MESASPLFGDGSVPSFAQIALLWAPEVLAIRGSWDETQDEISISQRGLGTEPEARCPSTTSQTHKSSDAGSQCDLKSTP